jgi:hypothetical protein
VTLTANDTGVRAVASTWYTLDGSDPTLADNPARHTYDPAARPTLGAGQRIRYASADSVGNVEGARTSLAAKVDTTAPATTDDVPAGAQPSAVTVRLTAADTGGSGVAQTWFTTDGSDPAVATNPARQRYGASVLRHASVRATGVPVTVKVPIGANVVRIEVVRAGARARAAAAAKAKRLATLYRFAKRPARCGRSSTRRRSGAV